MDIKEVPILGPDIDGHWYYVAKATAMQDILKPDPKSTILDIGAGSGFFSKWLLKNGSANEAWCVDPSYTRNSDISENGIRLHFRRSINQSNADLVLMMDVLEHVDDDLALLSNYVKKVGNGTRFLITVPAFQCLWSGHDDFLGHKRRYTLAQLEALVRRAGLRVDLGLYYFAFILPIAALARLAKKYIRKSEPPKSQLKIHNPFINYLLGLMCRLELPFIRANRLCGLSIFCYATKI